MAQQPKKTTKSEKMPTAKYIRGYTQKLVIKKLIPFMTNKEQEEVTFAGAVHKAVVEYMDRHGIS